MEHKSTSKTVRWTAVVMRWFVILFLFFDAVMKFIKPAPVVQTTVSELGYKDHHIFVHGTIVLISTLVFAMPRTRILGAILLTAHLGGAIASHLRVDNPLFSHTLFPVYVALLLWGSIWLVDERLRNLLPVSKQ